MYISQSSLLATLTAVLARVLHVRCLRLRATGGETPNLAVVLVTVHIFKK